MPTNEDILHVVDRALQSDEALCKIFSDVISIFVERLNLDRETFASEIDCLYAPAESDEMFQRMYNNYRVLVSNRIRSSNV